MSVFVRMHDECYKKHIAAVGHICSNPGYSQAPMAQLVHAIFDLLPDDLFTDEWHALLHPDSLNNALRRDSLLHYALPNVPLLDRLCNALLRNTLRNAPICDNTLDNLLPDAP